MKIYLASPFFHQEEITMYEEAIRILRNQGLNVFVPREHTIPNGWDMGDLGGNDGGSWD